MRAALITVLFALALSVCGPARATPALLVDADTREVLFAEEAGHPWYPASTTKLMTAYVVFEAIRSGEVTLETPVIISNRAMQEGSLRSGLRAGNAMRLRDALYAMVVGSANEVSVAIAETIAGSVADFSDRMNAAAKRLGMTATRFENPNGMYADAHRTTARDLAVLGLAMADDFPQYRRLFQTFEVVIDGKALTSENTLLTDFPGTLGFKTGFLCNSGRNLVALAERDGRRVLAVVLGATTGRERSERTAKLMTEAFSGELSGTGTKLEAIDNRPDLQPENMRQRLCTADTTPAYEAERNRLYPMGLPGERSYLDASVAPLSYSFTPAPNAALLDVPKPTWRPVRP